MYRPREAENCRWGEVTKRDRDSLGPGGIATSRKEGKYTIPKMKKIGEEVFRKTTFLF